MSPRKPGRATRQILSGSELSPSDHSIAGRSSENQPKSLPFLYMLALSALVILSAIVWAFWGLGTASPLLLLLSVGLVASWLVV
jgi:hypothetical protein